MQLPLYTIWKTGNPSALVFTVFHCAAGDVLIALTLALTLIGNDAWPNETYVGVAAVATASGLGYTRVQRMAQLRGAGLGLSLGHAHIAASADRSCAHSAMVDRAAAGLLDDAKQAHTRRAGCANMKELRMVVALSLSRLRC